MTINIDTVQPGDPITADAWNNIVTQLKALDSRVSYLESSTPGTNGQFAITGLSAATVNVGDPLTVFGAHFGLPATNFVTLQIGSQATNVPQSNYDLGNSNDGQLKFTVPPIAGLGSGGQVTMQIVNNNGNDKRTLTINQIVVSIPTGNLTVTFTGVKNVGNPASNTVDSGGTYLLTYNIKAFTTRSDTYTLTLAPTIGTATYVDNNLNPISPVEVFLPITPNGGPGVDVKIQLKMPDGVTNGTGTMGLVATSKLNPSLTQPSGAQTFTIGSPLPTVGTIGLSTSGSGGISNGTFDSKGVLDLSTGVQCVLTLIAAIPNGSPTGSYFISFRFDSNPSSLWSAAFLTLGGNPIQWTTGQPRLAVGITGAAGASDTIVHIRINAGTDGNGTPFGELPLQLHLT
jgi:hypothetical protein